MAPNHSGTGISHHHFNLLAVGRLVAMDWAFGTIGFLLLEPTTRETNPRVVKELLAGWTNVGPQAVLALTITGHHRLHRLPLASEPPLELARPAPRIRPAKRLGTYRPSQ